MVNWHFLGELWELGVTCYRKHLGWHVTQNRLLVNWAHTLLLPHFLVFNAFPDIKLLTHRKSIIEITSPMNSPEPCSKCRGQLTLPGGGSRLVLNIRSDKCYLAKRETVLSSQDLTVRSWPWWPHTFLPALWPYEGQHQVGSLPPVSLVKSRLQGWWVVTCLPLYQWLPPSGAFSSESVLVIDVQNKSRTGRPGPMWQYKPFFSYFCQEWDIVLTNEKN